MRWHGLLLRELRYHSGNFFLTVLALAVAVTTLLSARLVLNASDRETDRVLADKNAELDDTMAHLKNEMRLAMLKLTFNLVILPEGQDLHEWHHTGAGTKTMPEEYVERLADSGIVSVRHFLPSLQQRVVWPETGRRIVLVGSRGEVPNLHKRAVKPLVQPVPDGGIVLGHELHRSLGIREGDRVTLMGREFGVHLCHEERGSQDDITAWIPLHTAQEIFAKPGEINAILALECLCVGEASLPQVRREIAGILPGTQVFEQGSKVLARAEARMRLGEEAAQALEAETAARAALVSRRQRSASILVPLIVAASGFWVAVLSLLNVRERFAEIALLRSLGLSSWRVLFLIIVRACLAAFPGALLGIAFGFGSGVFLGRWLVHVGDPLALGWLRLPLSYYLLILGIAVLLAGIAAWFPALVAVRRDPAAALRES